MAKLLSSNAIVTSGLLIMSLMLYAVNMIVNIARGTTDPEIDSVTWIILGNNMAPLTLVANLATR